jgi:UDP-N-acetylmuramyl pentapeptide phosphotransferase/UDP-N-acetylglucosamine-1-phosphate transferase
MAAFGDGLSPWSVAVVGVIVAGASAFALVRWSRAPAAENHRGSRVPVVLGWALAAAAGAGALAVGTPPWPYGPGGSPAGFPLVADGPPTMALVVARVCVGAAIVFAAGLVDDLVDDGPRGIRGHLGALVSGHVTTGFVKLVVAVGAAVAVVAVLPPRGLPVDAAAVVTIAGSTNVWNGLDVAPGRAAKFFLLAASPFALTWQVAGPGPIVPACWGGALGVLGFDLRERGMLGDAGSTLLGFAAGLGLVLAVPDWGVVLGALGVVALNAVAETITLSRAIDAVPPLRWFDRLGRLPAD